MYEGPSTTRERPLPLVRRKMRVPISRLYDTAPDHPERIATIWVPARPRLSGSEPLQGSG